MPIGTLFVAPEWHSTAEGHNSLAALRHKNGNRRKPFCVLERPLYPAPFPDVFEYKIFVSGNDAVGKSSVIGKLSANGVSRDYWETVGIQKSLVYWPAKIVEVDRLVLFKLHLWDAGEKSIDKFDHLLPSLKDSADGAIFVFSFIDKSSFTDLPHRIVRVLADDENVCKFVVGTKLDRQNEIEVTQRDVANFESQWSMKVVTVQNIFSVTGGGSISTQSEIDDVASTLNYICDQLWLRDQMNAGKIRRPANVPRPMQT